MKKTYEKPTITIELFSDRDIIVCSIIELPEDPGPIEFNSHVGNDA